MLNEQKKQTANPNLQTQVLKFGGRDKKIRMEKNEDMVMGMRNEKI